MPSNSANVVEAESKSMRPHDMALWMILEKEGVFVCEDNLTKKLAFISY